MVTLSMIYATPIPRCGHKKLVTGCGDCWERAFSLLRKQKEEVKEAQRMSDERGRQTMASSIAFNSVGRHRCSYCGGIDLL